MASMVNGKCNEMIGIHSVNAMRTSNLGSQVKFSISNLYVRHWFKKPIVPL